MKIEIQQTEDFEKEIYRVVSENLDDHVFELECPGCNALNKVTGKQMRIGDTVVCVGCHSTIHLVDKDKTLEEFYRKGH